MAETVRAKAGKREWIALGVLLLACLLVSMDVSVLYFAVPFISRELEPTSLQQLWIFDIYGFMLAGLLITMGSLGDRIGRRRLLLSGAAAFGAASIAAAYSGSAEMLIVSRAVLGVAGATLMPSTLALIRNIFRDEGQRGTAVSIWSAALVGGVALGPVLSGLLLERFWWGSVFLINVPAMVLLLVLGPILLPEFRASRSGRFDLFSAVLSLAAVLPVIYGIKETAKYGPEPGAVLSMVVGLILAVVFVRRQRRLTDPMIDPTLFRARGFGGALLLNLVGMAAMVGLAIFLTQYLQSVLGMSPLEAALWSLLPSLVVGGAAPTAAAFARRADRAYVIAAGFTLAAVGFIAMTFVEMGTPLWYVLLFNAFYSAGLVAVSSLNSDLVVGVAPPERAGSASALLESGSELGGALGMAVLGSIGTAVYTRGMADALPSGLPERAADVAGETLAGAVAVADGLSPALAETVLHTAREAFLDGMNVVTAVAGGLMLAAAVLAVVLVRGVRLGDGHGDGTGGEPSEGAEWAEAESPAARRTAARRAESFQ